MDEQELELDRPEWSIPGLEQARVETLAGKARSIPAFH